MLSCRQNTTTHITNHIHEWRRRHSLCNIKLVESIFLDWFLKSLLPPIAKDVASESPQIEEEAILKAQQFDLIYAQSGNLYTIIPDAPRVGTSYHDADGIIGSVSHQPQHHLKPLAMPPQPSNTPSVSYPNQASDYERIMSQSEVRTSYAQPMPEQ